MQSENRIRTGHLLELAFGWLGALIGIALLLVGAVLPERFSTLHTILAEIGAILVGVSIIHTAYEKVLRKHHEQDVLDAVDSRLQERWEGYKSYRKYASAGVIAFYNELPYDRVCNDMGHSEHVKVLKTFFQENKFEDAWSRCLKRSVESTVSIFLAEPNSELLRVRSSSLGPDVDHGRRKVIEEVMKIRKRLVTEKNIGRVSVTIYDGWPGAPLILCDHKIYVGTYLRGKRSFETPWVEVKRHTDLGRFLEEQFQALDCVTVLNTPTAFENWINDHPLHPVPVRNAG